MKGNRSIFVLLASLASFAAGCGVRHPDAVLILTQIPIRDSESPVLVGDLDARYPSGSRVVVVNPANRRLLRILSDGLDSAGQPVLAPDGERVLFSGKPQAGGPWQIFESSTAGGRPRQVTHAPSGAASPVWLPGERFAYCCPVPGKDRREPSDIYVQSILDVASERLTFATGCISDLTMLADGRILFVGSFRPDSSEESSGLYTVNNDGTELTAFAATQVRSARFHRPRQLDDGRVVFLSERCVATGVERVAEQVDMARPFSSRRHFEPELEGQVGSIEPGYEGELLVALQRTQIGRGSISYGIFALPADGSGHAELRFDDSRWHDVEAVACHPRRPPMGRVSTVNRASNRAQLLCLDANFSDDAAPSNGAARAASIRVLAQGHHESSEVLGVASVQEDGSFLLEVPADRALGFETLDRDGRVIRHVAPLLWLRPGEMRACVGCHEPHNRSPQNFRPLAVRQPPTLIGLEAELVGLQSKR